MERTEIPGARTTAHSAAEQRLKVDTGKRKILRKVVKKVCDKKY